MNHGRWAILLLAALSYVVPGCSGNVNDDSVNVINVRLMSLSSGGAFGNSSSRQAKCSTDGRYVVFESSASNLDPRDTNTIGDIFVRDTQTNTTTLASVNSTGTSGGSSSSRSSAISGDGRFVAFGSFATNLVAGLTDTNSNDDVFLRDMVDNVTVGISVTPAGTATGAQGAYLFSGGLTSTPVIADASAVYVAFISYSSGGDLLSGGAASGYYEVYLRRIPRDVAGSLIPASAGTILVSRSATDATGRDGSNNFNGSPSLGQDASNVYVAWHSQGAVSNLITGGSATTYNVYVKSVAKAGWSTPPVLGTPAVGATGLVSRDIASATTGGNGDSQNCWISSDGEYVAFDSAATNLLVAGSDLNGGTKDIFRRGPLVTGPAATAIVSLTSTGTQATQDSTFPSTSATGQFVTFQSSAPDIVSGDGAGFTDVFVRDVTAGSTTRASLTALGSEPNSQCQNGAISGDGQFTVFDSSATNMIASGGTFAQQVYRRGP
jgi:hypothetical protein